jgi:hypothetical protein
MDNVTEVVALLRQQAHALLAAWLRDGLITGIGRMENSDPCGR